MVFKWIEASAIATAIRQSTWLYPFIEIIHILGIVLVAGGALLFDIQVLSKNKIENRYLLSWSKRGLLLAIPSGMLLFSTNAIALSHDPVFGLKLLFLLFAGINAYTARQTATPYHAIISIACWLTIITCGRLLAY